MTWHQFPSLPEGTTNPKSHESFFLTKDGVATRLQAPNNAAFPLRLHAIGIQHMEWHNATVTCSTPSCPDSGHPGTTTTPAGTVRVHRLSYIHLEPTQGALSGYADVLLAAVGGPIVDASIDGHLRLQDARFLGSCPGGPCPDPEGRTFLAEGNMSLSNLSPREGRLRGDLTGRFTSAAFDESPQSDFTTATGTAVAAGVALLGLAWIIKYVVGLFVRSDRPSALVHRKRRRLYELVKDEPGMSFRDLHRHLGWPDGTLRFHLQRLIDEGLVAAEPYRNTIRHFENHGRYTQIWKPVMLLQDQDHRRLHDWVLQYPNLNQVQIIQKTETWGWTRSTTLRRLANLTEARLLEKRVENRRALYQAIPAPNPPYVKRPTCPS